MNNELQIASSAPGVTAIRRESPSTFTSETGIVVTAALAAITPH